MVVIRGTTCKRRVWGEGGGDCGRGPSHPVVDIAGGSLQNCGKLWLLWERRPGGTRIRLTTDRLSQDDATTDVLCNGTPPPQMRPPPSR